MKLLIMGNNGHLGGLSVHYTTLLNYLQKEDIELFCIHVNDNNEKIFKDSKITEIVIPYQPSTTIKKIKKFFSLYRAAAKAKSFAPDIYVATGLGYGYALIASKLPISVFKVFEEVHFEAKLDALRSKMVENFNAVATQTKGMIQQFKENVSDAKPVGCLPCFSKEYQVNTYENIPKIDKNIRLAYFGRLAWNKGLKEFLISTEGIFKSNDVIFDIYGNGSEKVVLQQLINDIGLNEQVKLKGFYTDEDFPALISSYHAVTLPSIATEGLPLILIEAMCFGRPLFTTTTGAMPEIGNINKDGMLVSEKDTAIMAANFELFLNNLKNERYSAKYINNIYVNNFSNEAFMKVWLKMLHNPAEYFSANEK